MTLRIWNWVPWRWARRMQQRVLFEDSLKWLFARRHDGLSADVRGLAETLGVSRKRALQIVERLARLGLVSRSPEGTIDLTDAGRDEAARIVRVHRLVETFLAEESGLPPEEWHAVADRLEHAAGEEEVEQIARRLGNPRFDPHGDPIPTPTGEIEALPGEPLAGFEPGSRGRIVHIEDEPHDVYQGLLDRGFELGRQVSIVRDEGAARVVEIDGRREVLSPQAAVNVSLERLSEDEPEERPTRPLSALKVGETGVVRDIAAACRGLQRRRLLDLGFVPGSKVTAEFSSPAGDPVAYRVRGTLIALRRDQAALIRIEPQEVSRPEPVASVAG